jgi:hypothetical protein
MTDDRLFVHDIRNFFGIILGYSALLLDEMASGDPRRTDIDEIRKASEAASARLDDWQNPAHSAGHNLK